MDLRVPSPNAKFSRCFIALRRRALYHSRPRGTTVPGASRHLVRPVPVTIKNKEEQRLMREAGRLAAEVLVMIEPHVQPGVTTDELNERCHAYIVDELKATPAPLNYKGFPKSICTSVNHVVCHGIPGPKKLKKGDILNVDVTVIKDGFHGDTSRMFYLGEPPVLARRLCEAAHAAMVEGIRRVRPGTRLGDLGHAVQKSAEGQGFSVVREYCGHGIGRIFHEDPQVLHYGTPGTGMALEPGMTFTIEPMINAGRPEVRLLPDGWTVVTKDHSLSAQWEHTVLVTPDGAEILTLRNGAI
jgi:methionyl aminopeptidase